LLVKATDIEKNTILLDMSSLLFSCNRSYLKFYIFYRHLSTIIERQTSNQLVSTLAYRNSLYILTQRHYQKRTITLNAPSIDEKQKSSIRNNKIPFQFPPGKPNDKPKLEHLRFIEDQLIQIVRKDYFFIILLQYLCFFSYQIFANECIHMPFIQLI